MTRKRNTVVREDYRKGGRVRLWHGVRPYRRDFSSQDEFEFALEAYNTYHANNPDPNDPNSPNTPSTPGVPNYDPANTGYEWTPGGQGSGQYADITDESATSVREKVSSALTGELPDSAKIKTAKTNKAIAGSAKQMVDPGDATAEKIVQPDEETVATGKASAARRGKDRPVATMTAAKVADSPFIKGKEGTLSDEAVAEVQEASLSLSAQGISVDQDQASQALSQIVTGTVSPQAKATAAKVAGTNLPRMLRAKKQLRKAGLTEEQIQDIGNNPDALEDKVGDYTEAERGMIAGLPEEALVSHQLTTLLEGVEEGEIPIFARPAVAAVNNMLAKRGLEASSVGRDALINSFITAAIPLAQSNAQSIKESVFNQRGIEAQAAQADAQMAQQTALANANNVFQMDMANFSAEQQTRLSNSKFLQTVSLTDTSAENTAVLQNAANMANLDMANLDANTKLAAQNAQSFLSMDMQNLSNAQQGHILKAQLEQQRLLTNQSAENAARNANMIGTNQAQQFMATMAQQVELSNAQQKTAMAQFNAAQENAAEARRVAIEADLNRANAAMVTEINKYNNQVDFNREQWNKANAQAVAQSNVQWRRQSNMIDTAAANEANMRNAMNAFGLSTQALGFLWQEMRDQATFDNKWADNEETRKTQLLATAIANEGEASSNWSSNLGTIEALVKRFFG